MRSRTDRNRPSADAFRVLERRHVRRRRRRRRAEQHLQHPLAALHRRGAIGHRREQQDAALRQQAAARLRQRHAAEAGAGDVGNAVVPREPLVDERVVGGDQIEHAAVLADDAVEEELGFLDERLGQRAVPVR